MLEDAVGFLRARLTRAPRAVLVLGSGLGPVADELDDAVRVAYAAIPGFPESTVHGHAGALVAGVFEGVEVVAMLGRFHLYEGLAPDTVTFPLRVLSALGADHLIVTNAAGGIRPGMVAGELMLIADHINFTFRSPLAGPVVPGDERFPDLSDPYDAAMRQTAHRVADRLGIPLTQGVYAAVLGPSYETPAEVRMLRRLGADAIGMSTVPEVIVARAIGMRVLAFSCITNLATGLGTGRLSHEEVLAVGAAASANLARLLRAVIPAAIPANLPSEAAS